jgi:hypothetical protein
VAELGDLDGGPVQMRQAEISPATTEVLPMLRVCPPMTMVGMGKASG